LPAVTVAQVQINQNFNAQGPAPSYGPFRIVDSADAGGGTTGTVAGAVQAILVDPWLGPNTYFIGATSGGIWKTTDGGNNWTPLTDNRSVLSIASLGLDATDTTGRTLIAGTGITSSGYWSPALTPDHRPLIYSTDGGDNWTPLAGANAFSEQSVLGVVASGSTILAATFELSDPTRTLGPNGAPYGLYRSADGGASFTLVNNPNEPLSSLPVAGPVTALVADKSDPQHQTFYAAVTSQTEKAKQGVFVTYDAGETWDKFFTIDTVPTGGANAITIDDQVTFRLATGPNGEVAIAIAKGNIGGTGPTAGDAALRGLYVTTDKGVSWNALTTPIVNDSKLALYKLGLAIDQNSPPGSSPIIYVSGDTAFPQGDPTYPSPVFRVPGDCLASDDPITCLGYKQLFCELKDGLCLPGSTPTGAVHADSRALAVDAAGNLLLVGDGGVYRLTNPLQDNGVWSGLNYTLQNREPYQIAYGAYAKRLVVAAQDTGVAIQSEPNSPIYNAVQGFDGYVALARDANDASFFDGPVSVYYTSQYDLAGLARLVLDSDGKAVNPNVFPDRQNETKVGVPVTCTFLGQTKSCGFVTESQWNSVVLNRIDQKRLAIAGDFNQLDPPTPVVYVTEDTAPASAHSVDLDLVSVGLVTGETTNIRLAYGAPGNPNALLASGDLGSSSFGSLWLTTTAGPSSLKEVAAYAFAGAGLPLSLVFGTSDENFYVADGSTIWGITDQGKTNFNSFASELSGLGVKGASSVEFINNNGVDALLVGGLMSCPTGTCASSQSPIALADSTEDGGLLNWRLFGSGLPNALVVNMSYNPLADVLAIAGVGRGLWTLYDVTSYFKQADVLRFGLANNDSSPDASYLTDGVRLDGTTFKRRFEKYGTGMTVIDGIASYTGGTTIFDGILQLGTGGMSGLILSDVNFCTDAIDSRNGLKRCNEGTNKFLVFNRSDTYSFAGAISGPGQLVQNGTGTTVLTGFSTFTGPTWVNQGALVVNGSLVSPVTVAEGALLGGNGSVGATTIADGGTFAPGNSIGTMTVNGNLKLSRGAIYEVEANAQGQSDKIVVKGTVNLTGAVLRVLAAGGDYKPRTDYVIIDNNGTDAVNGKFGEVINTLAFLDPSVIYNGGDGNDVVLTLERISFGSVAKTPNHRAVAGALDKFPTNDALFLTVLNQTEEGARQAFDALSGEIHATVAGALADDSRYVREAVLGRLMQASHRGESLAAGGPQVALIDSQAMTLGDGASLYDGKSLIEPAPAPLAFWTRAFGAWGDFDTDGNAASADRDLGGFISGMDAQVSGSLRVGVATGASFSNVSVDARYSGADVESYHLGGYASGMMESFALRGGGMWSWNSIETSRAVVFPGFFERQQADYHAGTGQFFGEIAYPSEVAGIAVEPFGGLAFVSVSADSFRERGGALASLRNVDLDHNVGYATLGLRAAKTMVWGEKEITPHLSVAWLHAFDEMTPGATLAFATTGIGFDVAGVPLAEDSVLLDAGLDFALSNRVSAGISYAGQYADDVSDNAVKGRLTWLFH
jgi:outer membrane autotransporter protein